MRGVLGVVALTAAVCATSSPDARAQSSSASAPQHQHGGHNPETPPASKKPEDLPPFIPRLTDEDRKAAFPDVDGHAVHDTKVSYFVLFDQLEWQGGSGASGLNLDSRGWVGRDRDRLWFRAEGEGDDGRVEEAQAHVMYGRLFSRWWDFVAGVRQDFRPGSLQTWLAVGVQGLAPYWFEIEATGYLGDSGRTQARFEVEYELLLTNRLVLQPLFEAELHGKSDPERGIGAGLSTTDVGLRLRYEFKRELAPYLGIVWRNRWGKTADLAEAAGDEAGGARVVTGVRLWF
jgi:copper resistance protein B